MCDGCWKVWLMPRLQWYISDDSFEFRETYLKSIDCGDCHLFECRKLIFYSRYFMQQYAEVAILQSCYTHVIPAGVISSVQKYWIRMVHFASASKTNSILNEFELSAMYSPFFFCTLSAIFTNRTDSLRMLIKLLRVFVGSLAWGGGYGNCNIDQIRNRARSDRCWCVVYVTYRCWTTSEKI